VSTIRDLRNTKWRDELLPAHYDGRLFHVDSGSTEGGRRVVTHQFPKKELPYSEDMGRRAREWTVRGYIIVYPHDSPNAPDLYRRDYRIARDNLRDRLDTGRPGVLQLPTFVKDQMVVVCPRYRLTEEEKLGGFCVFDMTFVEYGSSPFKPLPDSGTNLLTQSNALKQQIMAVWAAQKTATGRIGVEARLQNMPRPPTGTGGG
jgi:prophage DNA circulation protein